MLDMFRVGVISDTHLGKATNDFKEKLQRLFDNVGMIIHAGDMTGIEVYDYLCNWELKAVRGNMDDFGVKAILPEKRIEEVMGKRIGIIHGRGSPHGIENLVFSQFKDVDVIIFGHSHIPLNIKKEDVFMFNPGAFRGSYSYKGTVGMMEIEDEIILRHIEIP
jgi:putative phosphoesterase